jgi:hypothetical protein
MLPASETTTPGTVNLTVPPRRSRRYLIEKEIELLMACARKRPGEEAHEAARVHHFCRWRGSHVAGRRARTATGKRANGRCTVMHNEVSHKGLSSDEAFERSASEKAKKIQQALIG